MYCMFSENQRWNDICVYMVCVWRLYQSHDTASTGYTSAAFLILVSLKCSWYTAVITHPIVDPSFPYTHLFSTLHSARIDHQLSLMSVSCGAFGCPSLKKYINMTSQSPNLAKGVITSFLGVVTASAAMTQHDRIWSSGIGCFFLSFLMSPPKNVCISLYIWLYQKLNWWLNQETFKPIQAMVVF